MMKTTLLLGCVLLTQFLFSQTFTEVTQVPFEGVNVGSVTFADVDGDNDQDVLITGSGSSTILSALYTNDGAGNFTEVTNLPFDSVGSSSIAFADVDGDSDQDVLITGSTGSTRIAKLYLNDGIGNFSEAFGTPFDSVSTGSIAFADVDGDNDQDVLITGVNDAGRIAKLYINDGSGNFSEVVGTPFEGVGASEVAFADVDGDNDQDVLITGANGSERIAKLYTNDGSGTFTEVSGTPFEAVEGGSLDFADVDGDNDQDVLITGFNASSIAIAKLYLNDGSGTFTEVIGTPFNGVGVGSMAFADVDGDNDEDVLITGFTGFFPLSKLYTNDGIGIFSEVQGVGIDSVNFSAIAFADVDGDNDQDLIITGRDLDFIPIAKLYTNDGLINSTDELRLGFSFEVFPNPTQSNALSLQFDAIELGFLEISLYSFSGQLLSQNVEFVAQGQTTLSIDIASLSSGSYFIQIESGGRRGQARFVVR